MRSVLMAFLLSLVLAASAGSQPPPFAPGERVLLDAHNCYPYHGLWTNRLARALSTGTPLAVEVDLAWRADTDSGADRVLVAHGEPVTGGEPEFAEYFFEGVRSRVEAALEKGVKRDWPLFVLNINDIRTSDAACLAAVKETLTKYEDWLCTAERSADPLKVAPLRVRPILVLTESGQEAKRVFHDDVPIGGRICAFGRA